MPLTIALLAAINLAPAILAPQSAVVLPDGRAVQVVFQVPGPVAGTAPDWMPGWMAGASLKTDKGLVFEHLADVVTAPDGGLVWTSTFLAPEPLTCGTEVTLTAPAGLLRDDKGNVTAAFSALPVANHSLVDADGFTTRRFSRGRGGVTLYVSSTHGDDRATFAQAQTPRTPFKTIARALHLARENGQHTKGCAVRLLRGDTFEQRAGLPGFSTSGQDPTHPFIIEDYWYAYRRGETDPRTRPIVAVDQSSPSASDHAFCTAGGGKISHVVIRRLEVRAIRWEGEKPSRFGLSFVGAGENWTIDDCLITNFGTNIVVQRGGKDVTLLRCVVTDSRVDGRVNHEHTQGAFFEGVTGLLISQCAFDFNGRVSVDRTGRDVFSHNVYIQTTCGPAIVWGNAITHGGSHGVQLRPGGVLAYNYLGGNAIAAFVGYPGGAQFKNVVEGSQDIDAKKPRGFGLSMNAGGASSDFQAVERNFILNTEGHQQQAISIDAPSPSFTIRNAVIRHNTAVNAGPVILNFNLGRSSVPGMSLTFSNNINAPGGRAPAYTLPNFVEWGWLKAVNNVVPAGPAVARVGDRSLDLVAWRSVTGAETGSITQSPTFAEAGPGTSRRLSLFLKDLRTRPPGAWEDEFDMTVLYRAYARAYTPTNLPELKAAEGGYYGAVDYRKAHDGFQGGGRPNGP